MQDKAETRRMYQPRPPAEGSDRDALRNAIVQEEALLAVLEVQQEESRHRLAALRAELVLEQGRSPILLTERKDHLEYFAAQLSRIARHVVVLQGGMSASARREVKRQLEAIPTPKNESLSLPAATSAKASTMRGSIRSFWRYQFRGKER